MKYFGTFIAEANNDRFANNRVSDDVVMVNGRMNPPHAGHGMLLNKAKRLSESIGDKGQADLKVLLSRSQDPKKNPLTLERKMHHAGNMFPNLKENFDGDPRLRTFLNAATKYHQEGYKNLHLVGGSDRQSMIEPLRKYNGQEGFYNFDNIYWHNAGDRDPNSEDKMKSLSASKIRNMVMNGDFDSFKEAYSGIGDHWKQKNSKELYDDLGMHMRQQIYDHWEVDTRSNAQVLLEAYKNGYYIQEGDIINHDVTGLTGRVHRCGANHLICVTEDGVMFKSFIQDVTLI